MPCTSSQTFVATKHPMTGVGFLVLLAILARVANAMHTGVQYPLDKRVAPLTAAPDRGVDDEAPGVARLPLGPLTGESEVSLR